MSKIVTKRVPFSEFTREDFDPRTFDRSLWHGRHLEDKCSLDFNGKGVINLQGRYRPETAEVTVQTTSPKFKSSLLQDYISTVPVTSFVHESRSHRLTLGPNGGISLEFLAGGEPLDSNRNVYWGTFRQASQLKKAANEWSRIAAKLGFEPLPPQSISMDGDCEALKICTRSNKLKEGEVSSYVAEVLLKELENPASELVIKSSSGSTYRDGEEIKDFYRRSLTIGPNHATLLTYMDLVRDDIEFAVQKMIRPAKEPHVVYKTKVETRWDRLAHVFEYNEDAQLSALALLFPAIGTGLGALKGSQLGLPLEGAIAGAAIGTIIDTTIAGLAYGADAIQDWRNERESRRYKARQKFMEFAQNQSHLNEGHGYCVVVSTDKCVLQAAEEKETPKRKTPALGAVSSVFSVTPKG